METETNPTTGNSKPLQAQLFDLSQQEPAEEEKIQKDEKDTTIKSKFEPYIFYVPIDCR